MDSFLRVVGDLRWEVWLLELFALYVLFVDIVLLFRYARRRRPPRPVDYAAAAPHVVLLLDPELTELTARGEFTLRHDRHSD